MDCAFRGEAINTGRRGRSALLQRPGAAHFIIAQRFECGFRDVDDSQCIPAGVEDFSVFLALASAGCHRADGQQFSSRQPLDL
jgi:hypothetical protein